MERSKGDTSDCPMVAVAGSSGIRTPFDDPEGLSPGAACFQADRQGLRFRRIAISGLVVLAGMALFALTRCSGHRQPAAPYETRSWEAMGTYVSVTIAPIPESSADSDAGAARALETHRASTRPDLETLFARTRARVEDLEEILSNYRRFVEIHGRKYSHSIDPRTGRSAEAVPSVTVIGPDATTTDILGTALSVVGVREGLKLVESIPGIEALFVEETGKGDLRLVRSRGFSAYESQAMPRPNK